MVAGLAIQVASLITFMALSAEFAWRVKNHKGSSNPKYANLYHSRRFKNFLYSMSSHLEYLRPFAETPL
jgi:RTA1 like protein